MKLALMLALLAGGCVHATLDQSRVFQPGACRASVVTESVAAPFAINPVRVEVEDTIALRTVLLQPEKARGTLIYFGGNSIRHCADALRDTSNATLLRNLASLEMNVLLVNYRGYGGSSGRPSFEAVKRDALAVYDFVVGEKLVGPVAVHGQSLGTLFAASVAAYRPVAAVVLESPPTTYRDVISEATPWYAKPFVRVTITEDVKRESTLPVAARVYQRTLVVVGSKDPLTPPAMARRVYDALGSRQKKIQVVMNGRHGDLVQYPEYWQALRAFLRP